MFSPKYVLDEILPLAVSSYGQIPFPKQWKPIGKIQPENTGSVVRYVDPATDKITVAVSVSGTENLEQWLRDFDFLMMANPYGPGRVHRGFCLWQQAMSNSIWAAIDGTGYDELLLIGHSAGCPLSSLMAAQIARDAPQYAARVVGYGFEAPRVYDAEATAWFNKWFPNWWRIVNRRWDPIPQEPGREFGFTPEGTEIRIDGGMTMNVHVAHGLVSGVEPGLKKLIEKGG